MNVEIVTALSGTKHEKWRTLVTNEGLCSDEPREVTALLWDEGELVATGSRDGNILKLIAVDSTRQGEDLTAKIITALRTDAINHGLSHLFLYTKPRMESIFRSLFFYTVAKTDDVLVMESKRNGINEFIDSIRASVSDGIVGCAVMNCNPFTKGHRYLIEKAKSECDLLYVFVLSEDKSEFSAQDRLEMVRRGVSDIDGVRVVPSGPYLISGLTFPTYFLKDRESATEVRCGVDIEIFAKHLAPALGITKRFVGSEPLSPLTERYNLSLRENLPKHGIEYREIPRLEANERPVSASEVRRLIKDGDLERLTDLLPKTTLEYLRERGYIKEDDHA